MATPSCREFRVELLDEARCSRAEVAEGAVEATAFDERRVVEVVGADAGRRGDYFDHAVQPPPFRVAKAHPGLLLLEQPAGIPLTDLLRVRDQLPILADGVSDQ